MHPQLIHLPAIWRPLCLCPSSTLTGRVSSRRIRIHAGLVPLLLSSPGPPARPVFPVCALGPFLFSLGYTWLYVPPLAGCLARPVALVGGTRAGTLSWARPRPASAAPPRR